MLRALAVVVCVCASALSQTAPPPAGTVQVGGVIRCSRLALPGATVTATQGSRRLVTSADESGRYLFAAIPPGTWTFEVELVGFSRLRRQATVAAGKGLDWNLEVLTASAPSVPAAPAAASARHGSVTALPRAGTMPPRSAGPGNGIAAPRPGFQSVAVNQTVETEVLAAVANAPAASGPAPEPTDANEAFLMNGSLSSGLQQAQQEDMLAQRRGEWQQRDVPFGAGNGDPRFASGPPGSGGPGGPGGIGARGPGGPGGFGGRGGFGGPGGFGGRGGMMRGPGRGPGQGPRGLNGRQGVFGNRAGRGRQGIRGMAFFSLGNSALDARPFSLTGQTVDKPSYAQSRFGIVAGGPLHIPKVVQSDRTFFFINYFGTRARNPFNQVSTLPTAEQRAGDFSGTVVRGPVQVFDPLSRLPFPDSRVPADRIRPAAFGLLPFIPLPNQPGQVQNYQYVTSNSNNSNNLGVRLNHTFSSTNRFDSNVNVQSRNSRSAQLYGFRDSGEGRGVSAGLGWTHNFTSRTVNSLRFNFSRNRNETAPFFAYGENVAGALGIAGVSDNPVNYGPPNLSFTNFGGLTDASPMLVRNQTAGIDNGVTLVRGTHNLTVGAGYRRMQLNTVTDQNARGTFLFSGLATSGFDAQNQPLQGTGFDFADFLLGLPQSSSIRFGDTSTYFRGAADSAYAQDDWRLRANLTINAGLRYEYFTPFHEKYGRMANLDIAPGLTGVAVVTPGQVGPYTGAFPAGLIDPDKNNFSPRLGLAWRPWPKRQMQIRAGYGIFFNGSIYNQFPSRLAAQPPFANTATLVTSLSRPLTIENGFAAAPSQTITNSYAVAREYRVGYAQTWNASIQQSLPHSLVVEAGYLGTKGTRLDIQRLPNRAAPGSPLTAEQRRLVGNAVGFTLDTSDGNSIYHAGQVRVTRRFSHGVSFNALYTLAKSIDNASTLGGGGAVVAQNDQDLKAERGLSSFDQRHTLSLFYILTSPVSETGALPGGSRLAQRLLKDWTLSGGMTAGSGTPLTARVMGNQSDTGGTGSVGSGRADATGAPIQAAGGFFNLGAFMTPPPGRFGNAGRNTIPGPGRLSLNLSFGRSFRIDDRRRVELRAESQNFLNHVSYTALGTVINASNYGLPTAAASMRTISLTTRIRF